MPIYPLLRNMPFTAEEVRGISEAFEHALVTFNMTDRDDALTHMMAAKIIELAQQGERDPKRLHDRLVEDFRGPRP